MIKIALIGSTGSIGKQTLKIVKNHPEKFEIVSLSAHNNCSLLLEQILEFKPKVACLDNMPNGEKIPNGVEFYSGENAYLNAVIKEADLVVVSVVGFAGLSAVLKAIDLKKNVALANKESLVVGGEIVTKKAEENGVKIIPIDSEHSAIWQSLHFDKTLPFKRLIITASGGPFRTFTKERLSSVTVEQALNHPTWNMGGKITIDSATMMNKGLEVIEAHWLYNVPYEKIDVVVHKESVIHSLVEYEDNSVICQMSYPTMEIPISLALSYPERLTTEVKSLDLVKLGSLHFEELDKAKFRCFDLAVESGKKGGVYPAIMSGANEQAVYSFLKGQIKFEQIADNIESALSAFDGKNETTFENLKAVDGWARLQVRKNIKS